MSMSRLGLLCLTGVWLATTIDQAYACGQGKLLLEDKFAKPSPVWGLRVDDKIDKFGPSGYQVTLTGDQQRDLLNQSGYFDNYEVCLTVSAPPQCSKTDTCEAKPLVGLTFWGVDTSSKYSLDISPTFATYSISREQNNKWLRPIPWTNLPDDAMKPQFKGPIELSVQVKGSSLVASINGVKVTDFDGMPPNGGSLVGFSIWTSESDTSPSTFNVTDFQVRELPQ
ncbi:MAG: hypothetical protein U1E46_00680 [Hyphomicrobiales bacterium]